MRPDRWAAEVPNRPHCRRSPRMPAMRGGARVRGMLPLRAAPQGELLDTGVVLFRARALPLLMLAAPLLAIEQIILWYAGAARLHEYADPAVWWRVIAA